MKENGSSLRYPAFTWHDNYVQLVTKPLEMCAHARSMFNENVRRARCQNEHVIDACGRYFDIVDWRRVPTFGGIEGFVLMMVGTIFAEPVLANEKQLSLDEFKKTIARAMKSRYAYDLDKYPGVDTVRKLKTAQTYEEALDAVPKLSG